MGHNPELKSQPFKIKTIMKTYYYLSLLPLLLSLLTPQVYSFTIDGQWREGELLIGKTESKAKVWFENKPIKVGDDGLFIIGLNRDEAKQVTVSVVTEAGNTITGVFNVENRDYNIQKVEGIASNIMQPSADDLTRARSESRAIGKAKKVVSDRRDFLNDFIIPVKGPTTGIYGSQRYYNGKPGRPHYGWDIAAPTGTDVKAPNSGTVIFAQLDTFYSGGLIIMDHGFHLSSSFLHLDDIYVKVGDNVKKGAVIGAVGATGRVTGSHLDWRMNWGKRRIDPQVLIKSEKLL